MSLQDWGALGELIGGVAIIVSLIYVGLQIRHSAKATRAATIQAFSEQYSNIMRHIAEPSIRNVFWKGIDDLDNLEGDELVAFMALMGSIVRTYETFFFEAKEGRFDTRMYDGWMAQRNDLFAQKGVRQYWELRRHQFSPEFAEHLDRMSAEVSPKPLFPRTS